MMITIYQIFGTVIISLMMCLTGVCTTKCSQDFKRDINDANELPVYELQRRQVCCALNHYRQCMSDNLDDKCPINDENEMFDSVFKLAVKGVEFSADIDCQYYEDGSWLCAPDYVFVLVAVGLVVLLLALVYICCCRARKSGRRDSVRFMILPEHRY
ncbi:uncharacterized protein LOC128961227 isoform X2 [Oppia nitens]|uniref:uncharacterized protein LOC128961227 isoform X2 n=1 Tax=Oppia nitens TaxID=1686743 RepID=UPI0023D97FA7|nr:uncharacterized protein LOC128961227 isoform X2 [Oppia nitens]